MVSENILRKNCHTDIVMSLLEFKNGFIKSGLNDATIKKMLNKTKLKMGIQKK